MSRPDFTVEVFQNEFLPDGGREVNAIVTVTAPDSDAAAATASQGGGASRAEIIIIDCSGSTTPVPRSPRPGRPPRRPST